MLENSLKILLVEDDETVGQTTKDMFEMLGHDVTWAKSAEEALRLIADAPFQSFHLLYTDLDCPRFNEGYVVAETGQQMHDFADLQVAIASGHEIYNPPGREWVNVSKPVRLARLDEICNDVVALLNALAVNERL